jgi:PAS domain S-box-containing protein
MLRSEVKSTLKVDDASAPVVQRETVKLGEKLAEERYEALSKALEAERARLAAIVEGSRDAIWSWDIEGNILSWNAEAQRMFGYTNDEIIGKPLLLLVPKDRHAAARQVIGKLGQGEWFGQYETVRVRRDGRPIDVELTVSPIRDAENQVIGACTVCRDITDRKQVQAALAKRVAELTTLYQLTERLQSARTPDDIYQAALTAIADALNCERASILLFDASQAMRFVAWLGLSESYRTAVNGHSPWTPDVQSPQPIYVEDIRFSGETDALKATVETEGIRALAFIPLIANDKLIGKFMTYYPEPHCFTEHETSLANTIARQLALAVSRYRYEDAPVMIWISDQQGQCLHLNRMLRTFWGVDEASISDFDWSRTLHPDDAYDIQTQVMNALKNQSSVTIKGRYADAASRYRVLQTDARPRFSAAGEFLGMIGVNVDVTEREEAEEALRKSEQRFRNAVEAAPSGMIMTDSEGHIVLSNAHSERLFGYTRDELEGKKIEILVPERFRDPHPNLRSGYYEHPSARPMGLRRDLFARRKDGTELPVEIGLSPIETDEGLMTLAAIVDISERKKAEAHRELLIAELNHRVKNTLSTVQSLAWQTFKDSPNRPTVKAFEARLIALSSAHDVLTRENWESAGLREIIEQAIAPHRSDVDDRFAIEGPEVRLTPKSALAIAMGLHELCTNAAKYGALSIPKGRVSISWGVDRGVSPAQFNLLWQERGGPIVKPPQRKGFGSLLVEKLLASDLGGTVVLSYAPEGVTCSILAPLHDVGGHVPGVVYG